MLKKGQAAHRTGSKQKGQTRARVRQPPAGPALPCPAPELDAPRLVASPILAHPRSSRSRTRFSPSTRCASRRAPTRALLLRRPLDHPSNTRARYAQSLSFSNIARASSNCKRSASASIALAGSSRQDSRGPPGDRGDSASPAWPARSEADDALASDDEESDPSGCDVAKARNDRANERAAGIERGSARAARPAARPPRESIPKPPIGASVTRAHNVSRCETNARPRAQRRPLQRPRPRPRRPADARGAGRARQRAARVGHGGGACGTQISPPARRALEPDPKTHGERARTRTCRSNWFKDARQSDLRGDNASDRRCRAAQPALPPLFFR